MTREKIELLNLGIKPLDDRTILTIEAGLEWVKKNTTLEFDINNDEDLKALQPSVRLFLVEYVEIQSLGVGVASENIEGLSQSFHQVKKEDLIWDKASEVFGSDLKSRIKFVAARKKWV